jgi:outer membrane protein insertion porin family
MLPRLLAFSLLVWLAAPGQPRPAATTFPLRTLHVRGNKNLPEGEIIAATGLKLNQNVGKPELDAAKEKLLETGMFETVAFQFEPGTNGLCCNASFEVTEITALFPIQFENIPEPADKIEEFLKANVPLFEPMLPGTTQVIGFYAKQVERYLAMKNHKGSVVGTLVQTGKNEFKITFWMNSSLQVISNVTFSGSKEISAVKLQNAMNDVAYGVPYTRDGFRLLLDSQIRPLYDAMGMIRVKFPEITLEPDPRVKGVTVAVKVDEGGGIYKLDKVTISGADRDYVDTAQIKTGGGLNFDEVKAGLEKIKARLKREGYLHVAGEVDRTIDDEAKTVSINYVMEKGAQYAFGTLTIEGLDLKGEPAVRKLWGVAQGKPYNPSYPQHFLDRIREDGLFDGLGDTKFTTRIDEKSHVVDVVLKFAAAKPPVGSIPRAELP